MEKENRFDSLIKLYAGKYRLLWLLVKAQIWQESRFNPTAISPCGAKGLMQIMPETDFWLDQDYDGKILIDYIVKNDTDEGLILVREPTAFLTDIGRCWAPRKSCEGIEAPFIQCFNDNGVHLTGFPITCHTRNLPGRYHFFKEGFTLGQFFTPGIFQEDRFSTQ